MSVYVGQIGRVARIAQRIEIDDGVFRTGEQAPDQMRPDESRPSGEQYAHL